MKKLLFSILAALSLASCITGCSHSDIDYAGFSYLIWVNDSDHQITLSVTSERGEFTIENEIIEPGKRIETGMLEGGIAYCPPPSDYIRYITVTFEDGTKALYFKGDQPPYDYNYSQYDPTINWNYMSEVKGNRVIRTHWIYTFTNADYDAAAAQQPTE